MSLNDTPRANRVHIGIFGRTNSGKSSLINALTGQQAALVSSHCGTTTDPVFKAMEIHGIGPCVFIDTAGFDDTGLLGGLRVRATLEAVKKTDIALLVLTGVPDASEQSWLKRLQAQKIPVIPVLNQCDRLGEQADDVCRQVQDAISGQPAGSNAVAASTPEPATAGGSHSTPEPATTTGAAPADHPVSRQPAPAPIMVSALTGQGIDRLRQAIVRALPEDMGNENITGALARPGDVILLVMPQDIQAPKGRLILPQVQTIRELLDRKCSVLSCTADTFEATLSILKAPPVLIITDSQVFKAVYEKKPEESRLTSFSVLFAAYKGDGAYFRESARAIGQLTPGSRVLIAEACTHAPLSEDIGREKIPAMLRRRIGADLTIDMFSGQDFPDKLDGYDLIIHCGACMFNRKYVLSRVDQARMAGVPMTNDGMAIAWLQGILEHIEIPG